MTSGPLDSTAAMRRTAPTVALLKTLGLDETAAARSMEYFRRAGGTCDCRIAINAMTSDVVPSPE